MPARSLHFHGNDASHHGWRVLALFHQDRMKNELEGSGLVQAQAGPCGGCSWEFLPTSSCPQLQCFTCKPASSVFFLSSAKLQGYNLQRSNSRPTNKHFPRNFPKAKMAVQQMNPSLTRMLYEHPTSWLCYYRPACERKLQTILFIGHKITVCQA